MKFSEFTEYIPKILNQQLPAITAHLKMAPAERKASMMPEAYMANKPRQSAVMMLFYPKNDIAHLVLTKRNEYAGVHSSQISFPGGKAELTDKDLAHTALRETFEEIGITAEDIDVVMPFSELYIPPSNFLVQPYMGISYSTLQFNPNPYEVKSIIELPVGDLLDDAIVINVEMDTSYAQKIIVPAFQVGEHMVWGATAMILSELKETLKSVIE